MIFQSLIALYDRLDKDRKMPPYGFSIEDIGFVVTLDENGNMIGEPEDLRVKISTNKYDFRLSEVPYSNKVSVRGNNASTTSNFMVDKADYIFGMSGTKKTLKYHDTFISQITDVCGDSTDDGIVAVKLFLEKWTTDKSVELRDWKEISGMYGAWIAFRLKGDSCFVHEREIVKQLWTSFTSKEKFPVGISFIDGERHELQTQYVQFKFGSGASLVSFNKKAYESYGKAKGENAPISVDAEFKSSAALKYLFRSKTQRLRIGDATTVFWAEKDTPVEGLLANILNPAIEDQVANIPVQKFLESIKSGNMPADIKADGNTKFYILGLSLNKARFALRFWYVCSVEELLMRLHDHFNCLEMEHSDKDIPFPGIWHLLKETARETKDISPVLSGVLTRAILTGGNYPQNLYQGVIGRIRADQRINYLRASILKAVLQRNYKKEVPMSLDIERQEISYLLGRLFAVLEKAQLDALGKVNATIKDRFFSAASATPGSVFPRLLQLSQRHIEKAEYGYISDRRIAEIMEHIDSFPAHMNMQEQGLFAIAYYQQKNALWRNKETKNEGEEK